MSLLPTDDVVELLQSKQRLQDRFFECGASALWQSLGDVPLRTETFLRPEDMSATTATKSDDQEAGEKTGFRESPIGACRLGLECVCSRSPHVSSTAC